MNSNPFFIFMLTTAIITFALCFFTVTSNRDEARGATNYLLPSMFVIMLIFILSLAASLGGIGAVILIFFPCLILGFITHTLAQLQTPLKNADQAMLFLDVIKVGLQMGVQPEQALKELAAYKNHGLGPWLKDFALLIEHNAAFTEVLRGLPTKLPEPLINLLELAIHTGNLERLLPLCHKLIEAKRIKHTCTYNFMLYPFLPWITTLLLISGIIILFVPKLFRVFAELIFDLNLKLPIFIRPIFSPSLVNIAYCAIFVAVILYFLSLGQSIFRKTPLLKEFFSIVNYYFMPGGRPRLLSDFTRTLTLLLDSGVPEEKALLLAAEATANTEIIRRAAQGAVLLNDGIPLPEILKTYFDTRGELAWRFKNARFKDRHGRFTESIALWCDWLDTAAFRGEQIFYKSATVLMIILTALPVAYLAISFFYILTLTIETMVLW